jgi:phenylalanine-4-hydroxylase
MWKDYNNFIIRNKVHSMLEKRMWMCLGQYQYVCTKHVCCSAKLRGLANLGRHEDISEFQVIFKACLLESSGI